VVYTRVWGIEEPPRVESYVPVPIRVGDETVILGVGILSWHVPRSVDAAYLRLEERRRKEQEAADSAAARRGAAVPDTARSRSGTSRRDTTP
jgi:hypothetical protein